MQLDLEQGELEGEKKRGIIQAFHFVPLPYPSRMNSIYFNIKIKLSCPLSCLHPVAQLPSESEFGIQIFWQRTIRKFKI